MSNANAREELAERISSNSKAITAYKSQQENLSNRIDGIARSRNKSANDLQSKFYELNENLAKQNAELISLRNKQTLQAKAINQHLTSQPNMIPHSNLSPSAPAPANVENAPAPNNQQAHSVLNVIVEGLVEEANEDLPGKFTLVCECLGVTLQIGDIVCANRIERRKPIEGRPNPARNTFRDKAPKEKIMSVKGNLLKHDDLTGIWINHDETTLIRRAKGRARHIANYSRKKGFNACLDAHGVLLDNVFYAFDNMQAIPSIYLPPNTFILPPNDPQTSSTMVNRVNPTTSQSNLPNALPGRPYSQHDSTARPRLGASATERSDQNRPNLNAPIRDGTSQPIDRSFLSQPVGNHPRVNVNSGLMTGNRFNIPPPTWSNPPPPRLLDRAQQACLTMKV